MEVGGHGKNGETWKTTHLKMISEDLDRLHSTFLFNCAILERRSFHLSLWLSTTIKISKQQKGGGKTTQIVSSDFLGL